MNKLYKRLEKEIKILFYRLDLKGTVNTVKDAEYLGFDVIVLNRQFFVDLNFLLLLLEAEQNNIYKIDFKVNALNIGIFEMRFHISKV